MSGSDRLGPMSHRSDVSQRRLNDPKQTPACHVIGVGKEQQHPALSQRTLRHIFARLTANKQIKKLH